MPLRLLGKLTAAVVLLAASITGLALWLEPAMGAYACPQCFGLAKIGDNVYIDKAATKSDRRKLLARIADARRQTAAYFGGFEQRPKILACKTMTCDRRLGGRGASGRSYGATFIALSPRGWRTPTITHEFAHIYMHDAIGPIAMMRGRLPVWFDEGMAVVVSRSRRYLRRSRAGTLSCRVEPRPDLPKTNREWGRAAGSAKSQKRQIYAEAACKTLRWLRTNGGPDGVQAALARIAGGGRL